MHLLFNVLITDTRFSQGGLNRVDRLDLFKYTLASYACIDRITDVTIYCQLDGGYKDRESELVAWIDGLFPSCEVEFHPFSPSNQQEWQRALDAHTSLLHTAEPILYSGNDDHVFIDTDLSVLYEGLDLMWAEPLDQINTIHISSWPEAISTVYSLGEFETVGRYWVTDQLYPDAIQVVNSTFLRHVFFDLEMGDAPMRRTDSFLSNWYPYLGDCRFPSRTPHPAVKTFVPLRELVRHFDGYLHIGVTVEDCPMLEIPLGFWDGQIQLNGDAPENHPWFWRGYYAPGQKHPPVTIHFDPLENRLNVAHRRTMTAPHMRAWQDPTGRQTAKPAPRFRLFPHNERLPLEEHYLKLG